MTVVLLLSVIVLGLLAMFMQTQRAFRVGMTQVDVLESGRAFSQLIAGELAQIAPANGLAVNFYAGITPLPPSSDYTPVYQPLPGVGNAQRMNVFENLFFLTQKNQIWTAIGYKVDTTNNLLGTLYRYSASNTFGLDPALLSSQFLKYPFPGLYLDPPWPIPFQRGRVMEGVVSFKVRAFDTSSYWITPGVLRTNIFTSWSSTAPAELLFCRFTSNAVPAFVELEIGILEDSALARFKSLPTAAIQRTYLENHVGQVHVFRLRVPVRNVDFTAYQ